MSDEPTQPDDRPQDPAPDEAGTTATSTRRLRRPSSDRMIGGVAGGLGRMFDIDPVIFRIGFGVAAFLGGFGVLAYAALWLFTPTDDDDRAPVQRSGWAIAGAVVIAVLLLGAPWGGGPGFGWGAPWGLAWIAVAAVAVAAIYVALRRGRGGGVASFLAIAAIAFLILVAGAGLAVAAAVGTALGGGLAIAIAVLVAGALVVGAALGGRSARWLVVPAIAVAIGSAVAAGAGLDFEGGFGERSYRPASAAALPADGYRIGAGRIAVDLRDLDWRDERRVDLDVRAGAGEIVVAVPEDVCVDAAASAGVGAIEMLGDEVGGVDLEESSGAGDAPASTPTVGLDASVDIGHVVVVADDTVDIDDHGGRGPWNGGEFASSAGACSA